MRQDAGQSEKKRSILREERLHRHWSQRDLADKLGTTRVTISRWEAGATYPNAYFRQQLCEIFNKRIEEFNFFSEISAPQDDSEGASSTSVEDPLLHTACIWGVPYARNPFFTGRQEILQQMHQLLGQEASISLTQSWSLSGLGGVGKTQTAVEYAYRHAEDYRAILWMSAETHESLISSLTTIADMLQIPESQKQEPESIMPAVLRWLSSHSGWLLILDNVEDVDLVKQFLPSTRQGVLLFTSRKQTLGVMAHTLDLDPLTTEEGVRFLLHRSGGPKLTSALNDLTAAEITAAHDIVNAMDGLPLALDQAGAYIDETGCDLVHYRTLYQMYSATLLGRRGQLRGEYPHSVMATLSLSLKQVEERCKPAADLLRICAFISPDNIPEELFLAQGDTVDAPLPALTFNPLQLDEVLAILRNYSLIKRHVGKKLLSIHRLVQAVLKAQLDEQAYHDWAQNTILVVNYAFPAVEFVTTWSTCQRLHTHALICATLIKEEHIVTEEAGRLLHRIGASLIEIAQYTLAEACITQALMLRQQLLGPEHPDVAECLNYVAELAYYRGEYQQAEQIQKQALHIRQQTLGPKHPDTATSLNNLASSYWVRGLYEQAEPLYQRALEIREETLGKGHLDVAETLQNIAYLYFDQKRYQEAEPLYKRSLIICEQVLGLKHPYLVLIYNNLGQLYQAQKKYREAKELYQKANALCDQTVDPLHPHHAITMRNLAALAFIEGDIIQAEKWYQQALHIRSYAYGLKHPATAQSQHDLAILYQEDSRRELAIPLYQQALATRERVFGPDHAATIETRQRYQQALALDEAQKQ